MTRLEDAAHVARWRGSDLKMPESVKELAAQAARDAIEEGQKPEEGKLAAAAAAEKVYKKTQAVSAVRVRGIELGASQEVVASAVEAAEKAIDDAVEAAKKVQAKGQKPVDLLRVAAEAAQEVFRQQM